MKFNSNL